MNAGIYKLIFSKRLNALVAVGEICSSQGKAPGTTRASKRSATGMVQVIRILGMLSSGALMVSTAWATPAPNALPTGGQVVQGSASISQSGAQMDINQASQRAVINWQTFDVGADAKVHIIQPNQAAVLLNRVVTNKPSEIFGKIDANGQVVLVNNNGIVFGKDGSASAGSFTATTLDISDKDFMEGKTRFSSNGTQGEIVNHGTIEAKNGGYVALLGAKVSNDGKIITHNGTVALGAADSIAIPMTSSGKIKMQLSAGSLNAAVENTKNGVIVTEGGDVYLQAAAANNAMASIKHSGQIDTSGEQAGKAILLADSGEIKVDGSITANSSNAANKGGDIVIGRDTETGKLAKATDVSGAKLVSKGGFVETSGEFLAADGVHVQAKDWLLDPVNVEINATGTASTAGNSAVKASDIGNALTNGTNVTIETGTGSGSNSSSTGAPSSAGSTQGDGDITIDEAISSNYTATSNIPTLTLKANNGIIVNKDIKAQSGSNLNIDMTALGLGSASKGIQINNSIIDGGSKGDVTLTGTSTSKGIYIRDDIANAGVKGYNVTLNGTANVGSGVKGHGVYFDIFSGSTGSVTGQKLSIDAINDLNITGTVTGLGTGSGVIANSTWTGNVDAPGSALLMTAGGNATIKGIQTGNANNTDSAIALTGFRLNATKDIAMLAEAASSNSIAIGMLRGNGTFRYYDDAWRMQVRSSTGDVKIQSNQGAILGQDTGGGVNISGKNVIIDNTGAGMTIGGIANANGGSIDSATGAIVLGSGTSTYSSPSNNGFAGSWKPLGVSLSNVTDAGETTPDSVASVKASGNLTIGGSSDATWGLVSASALTAGGNVNLSARTKFSTTSALYVRNSITSTNGSVNLNGESLVTSLGGASNGVLLSGKTTVPVITAKEAITIKGSGATTAAVSLDADLKAKTIDVIGEHKGSLLGQQAVLVTGTHSFTATEGDIKFTGSSIKGVSNTGALQIRGNSNFSATNGATYLKGEVTGGGTTTNGYGVYFDPSSAPTIKNLTVTKGALNIEGSGFTGGVSLNYDKLDLVGDLTIKGTALGASGYGVNLGAQSDITTGGAVSITGNNTNASAASTGLGVNLMGKLTNKGGATTIQSTNSGITLASTAAITNTAQAGEIKLTVGDGTTASMAIIKAAASTNPYQIQQNANADVVITADGQGDVTVAKIDNQGNKNVRIVAGKLINAGDGTGGQIKTVVGNTISNPNGNTYLYSGNLVDTGTLSNVGLFNELWLEGAGKNIQMNTASDGASTITGVTAKHQVLFREAKTFDFGNSLKGATYTGTYGDLNTKIGNEGDLWSAVQSNLKQNNLNNNLSATLSSTNTGSNNVVKISAATVIDTLSGTLGANNPTDYSSSQHLKANSNNSNNSNGYIYSNVNSSQYTVGFANNEVVKAVVGAKEVTVSGITADNKVYNGTNAATFVTTGAQFTDMVQGDELNVASVTGTFDNKNVGNGKAVTLSGTSYSGADVGNYAITDQVSTTANITPKAVTVSGITASDKVYDANTNAAVNTANAAGWIAGDTVTVSATGAFDTKNVGNGKTVALSNTQYSGADAGNYTFTDQATTTANITPKAVTVSGITASDKIYDANTNAAVNTANAAGWIAGDTVTVSATGAFDTKNVGNGKTVALSNTQYGGADAGNYTFTDQATTTANITKNTLATVVLTAESGTKTYNGTTQSLMGLSASGLLGEDVANNAGVTASTSGRDVGTYNNTVFSNLAALENNYQNIIKKNGTLTIAQNTTPTNATAVNDPLLNPVPVNPNYKAPNSNVEVNELVTTQHNNEQIQKQCSLEFAKECKVQPATVQEIAPRYVTFY